MNIQTQTHSRPVCLAGVETVIFGAPDDPYFLAVEHHAAALGPLDAFVRRHVPRDGTVVDVGANLGLSTIILARAAARVIAYEPSPPNVGFLSRTLAINGVRNVEVRAAAATNQRGALRFHVAQFGAGSHVVGAGHVAGDRMGAIDVPGVALDEEDLPPVAFIKIDAEGHEPDVLAGARGLQGRDRPLVFTEVNVWCLSAFAGHSPGALVRTLWHAFEVGKPEADGSVSPLPDPYGFLHDLIVHGRGMADIVLRPRAGVPMPNLPALTWPAAAIAALQAGGGR